MVRLLNDDEMSGVYAVNRYLTNRVDVGLVDRDDLLDVLEAIQEACGTWGGAYNLLVPTKRGEAQVSPQWQRVIRDTAVTSTVTRRVAPIPLPSATRQEFGGYWYDQDAIGGYSILSIIAQLNKRRKRLATVQTANGIDPDDPWAIAYNAVWGRLAETPPESQAEYSSLKRGVRYDDVIRVDRDPPAELSAAHLLDSLRRPDYVTAPQLTSTRFSPGSARNAIGAFSPLPTRFDKAGEAGPNVIVIYEPGSVEDLCLLWQLRAAHGLRRGLPLGIPMTEQNIPDLLWRWWLEHAMQSSGSLTQKTRCYLVSSSVDSTILNGIAGKLGMDLFRVMSAEDVMQPAWGCGTHSVETATFTDGRATISAFHPTEEKALGPSINELRIGWHIIATPVGEELPVSEKLADRVMGSYRLRGAQVGASIFRSSMQVHWPSGANVLSAVLEDHGLVGRPSAPGRVAEVLLSRTDDIMNQYPLLRPEVNVLLAELGQRHDMNWYKNKLREQFPPGSGDEELDARLARIERQVASQAGVSSDEEQDGLVFHTIMNKLKCGRDATTSWVKWCEEKGLLARGALVKCIRCGSQRWRPVADLAPPVVCGSCGIPTEDPYGTDQIMFRYRATEFLMRLIKHDLIVHVLAYRFFSRLFRASLDDPSVIYGGYPGLDLFRKGETQSLGEADVFFVMSDGSLESVSASRMRPVSVRRS